MSAQPGRPIAPLPTAGQGGNPRTMILGMAGVALGLYGFWRLQFVKQNRSHGSQNAAEMPTWQFRHAQQVPEFNERMSAPGAMGTVPSSSAQKSANAALVSGAGAGSDGAAAASEATTAQQVPAEVAHPVRNVVSAVMTSLHGNDRDHSQDAAGHISQPATQRRLNDRGGMYTKNSDYKDGYRRD
ncbi:hypothetical protein BC628DRAFT_1316221 [Trametes gibbosa]|nr:hypothetical protein BC628DRAFT_1316221 [Trametes gibbosa]